MATLRLVDRCGAPAIMLGSLAARQENCLPDHLVRGTSFLGWAIPPFVLAMMVFGWMSNTRLMGGEHSGGAGERLCNPQRPQR